MKFTDKVLQRWRIAKARPYISNGARVLDIGCADGALFRHLKSRLGDGVGIDPDLNQSIEMGHCRLIAGWFPQDLPDARPFDVVTLLAVVEHVPSEHLPQMAQDCARFLRVGGSLVITAPEPAVDKILDWLKSLRVIDGMSLEEHHDFDPSVIPSIFAVGGLTLVKHIKFQLGLNNLFVFQKTQPKHPTPR